MGVTVIPNGPDPGMQLMSIAMGVKDLQRQSMENALLAAKRDLIPLQTKLMQNQVEASDFALALEKQFGPRDRELGQQSALAGIDQSNAAVRASNSQVKYRNFATKLQRDQFEHQVGIQNAELAMAQDRAVQQRDLFNAQIESQRALGLLEATKARTGLATHQRIQAMAESDNPLFRKAGVSLLMMGVNGGDPSQAYITTKNSDGKEVTLTIGDVVGAWVEQELTGKGKTVMPQGSESVSFEEMSQQAASIPGGASSAPGLLGETGAIAKEGLSQNFGGTAVRIGAAYQRMKDTASSGFSILGDILSGGSQLIGPAMERAATPVFNSDSHVRPEEVSTFNYDDNTVNDFNRILTGTLRNPQIDSGRFQAALRDNPDLLKYMFIFNRNVSEADIEPQRKKALVLMAQRIATGGGLEYLNSIQSQLSRNAQGLAPTVAQAFTDKEMKLLRQFANQIAQGN